MKLSFYARREHRCTAKRGAHGSANRYVGVEWDAENKCEVASKEPFTVDSERSDTSAELAASLLRKMMSRNGRKNPPLLPADEATARACGVEFVRSERVDGWWEPATAGRKPAPAAPASHKAE